MSGDLRFILDSEVGVTEDETVLTKLFQNLSPRIEFPSSWPPPTPRASPVKGEVKESGKAVTKGANENGQPKASSTHSSSKPTGLNPEAQPFVPSRPGIMVQQPMIRMPQSMPDDQQRPFLSNTPAQSQLQLNPRHMKQPPMYSPNHQSVVMSGSQLAPYHPVARFPPLGSQQLLGYGQCTTPVSYPLATPYQDSSIAGQMTATHTVAANQTAIPHPPVTLLRRDNKNTDISPQNPPPDAHSNCNDARPIMDPKISSSGLSHQDSAIVKKKVSFETDNTKVVTLKFGDVNIVSSQNEKVEIMTRGPHSVRAMRPMKTLESVSKSPVISSSSVDVAEKVKPDTEVRTAGSIPPQLVTAAISTSQQPKMNGSQTPTLTVNVPANSVGSSNRSSIEVPAEVTPSSLPAQTPASHVSSVTAQLSSPSATVSSVSSSTDHVTTSTKSWANLFATPNSSTTRPAETVPTSKIVASPPPLSNGASDEIGAILEKMTINPAAVPLHTRRLINKTNWCYVNATLQALLACPPFYHAVKAIPAFPPLSSISARDSSMPVLEAMVEFVNKFEVMQPEKAKRKKELRPGEAFEPSSVYNVLTAMTTSEALFTKGKQEDAEEFLTCLLNKMNEEMLAAITKYRKESNTPVVNGHDPPSAEEDEGEWHQVKQRNKSAVTHSNVDKIRTPILDIFGGQLRSSFHTGGKESVTLEQFFTVPLNVQTNKTVEEALHAFVSKESIDDYTCPQTKQELNAHRKLTFELLPPILILHLKCFVYDKHGGSQKVLHEMNFNENLDFDKELLAKSGSTNRRSYKLFAVVYHSGTKTTGGHYHTDVYHTGHQSWVRFDDNSTVIMDKSDVFKSKHPCVPYLLYYRQMDSR